MIFNRTVEFKVKIGKMSYLVPKFKKKKNKIHLFIILLDTHIIPILLQ